MIAAIKELHENLDAGQPVQSVNLRVIHAKVLDRPVVFCWNMKRDPIQRSHRNGRFYEFEELSQLLKVVKKNGVFLDIGANVGNHSLFFALFLNARKVIPFEPNPRAFNLLIQHVLLNGLREKFDLTHIGVGLSDKASSGFAMQDVSRNLGGARMLEGKGGLDVYRADALLKTETPDFIKIDVEGMELKVLAGLEGILERCKPMIFIEVDNVNETAFLDWVEQHDYAIALTKQRYKTNKNHLLVASRDVKKVIAKL